MVWRGWIAVSTVVYLGGRPGDPSVVEAAFPVNSLNRWIASGQVPPFVIIEVTFAVVDGEPEHWSSERNETFLTSQADGELRSYCREYLKAGLGPEAISLQGFSFGARGVLHHALRFPDHFASVVATAFVSDYALEEEQAVVLENPDRILEAGIPIRLTIGSEDEWVMGRGRQAPYLFSEFLDAQTIPHEFELLPGVGHDAHEISFSVRADGALNGLDDLRFHAAAWGKGGG